MSILISAPIRTGKTLYVVKCIFDELNKGRQVYTNIVGINIDGVISVASSIDDPFDWRDLPNGCVLVWDEAHEHPAFSEQDLLKTYRIDTTEYDKQKRLIEHDSAYTATQKKQKIEEVEKQYKIDLDKKKEQIRDIGRSLLLHGHFGIEIYFITQRVTKLNTDVLASVTTHFVMRRKFGMQASMIWEFGEAMTTWSKSTAQIALNKRLWKYPKYLFKFYKSSENHQVRKSYPKEVVFYGVLVALVLLIGTYKAFQTSFFGLLGEQKHAQKTEAATQKNETTQGITTKQENFDYDIECRKAENVKLPECVLWYDQLAKNSQASSEVISQDGTITVSYDPSNPYDFNPPAQIQIADYPRLSGCVKYDGRYRGYDQQGNYMRGIKQADCKRWMDGERLFDYTKTNQVNNAQNNTQVNYQNTVQQTAEQAVQPLTYTNNQVDPRLERRSVN